MRAPSFVISENRILAKKFLDASAGVRRERYGTTAALQTRSANACPVSYPASYMKSLRHWRRTWPKARRQRTFPDLQWLVSGGLHETERYRLRPGDCARPRR